MKIASIPGEQGWLYLFSIIQKVRSAEQCPSFFTPFFHTKYSPAPDDKIHGSGPSTFNFSNHRNPDSLPHPIHLIIKQVAIEFVFRVGCHGKLRIRDSTEWMWHEIKYRNPVSPVFYNKGSWPRRSSRRYGIAVQNDLPYIHRHRASLRVDP